MKKKALYPLITAVSLLLAGTVYGASNKAQVGLLDVSAEGKNLANFASVSVNHENRVSNRAQVGLLDVSPEGKNPFKNENVSRNYGNGESDSQIVDTKDMRDTTSNYGIGPEWGNAQDKESWYDLNVLGR